MMRLDPNRVAALVALIALAVLAVRSGYRIEIGVDGFKFERESVANKAAQNVIQPLAAR